MRAHCISYIIFLLLISCISSIQNDSKFPVIDIEKGLENFRISNLSEFASSIRYVTLETKEDCLVTAHLKGVFLEDNKIFVFDDEAYLKVFDKETGKHLYNVGSKGQGPGELTFLFSVNLNPHEKIITLCGKNIHQYYFDGSFLGKIEFPYINDTERVTQPVITLGENLFAGAVMHYGEDQQNMVIFFNRESEIISSLKNYDNPIQPTVVPSKVWNHFDQSGSFYLGSEGIRYFRGYTDTIYAFDKEKAAFIPFFIIDYGKYKSTLNFDPGKENPDLIKISRVQENDKCIFINFITQNASPQPYEDEIIGLDGQLHKFHNHSIVGIFDKQEGSFHFLRQPVLGIPGLGNDIDGGLPFFVRNVSSKNQLIDYYQADKFLEKVKLLPNPDNSLLEIINFVTVNDNPIVIIAE